MTAVALFRATTRLKSIKSCACCCCCRRVVAGPVTRLSSSRSAMPPESANAPRGEEKKKKKKKQPPKGKTSGAPADVLSTEDMSKQQLEEHVTHLREELEREREERSFFQLERDKIRSSWEVSQRHLRETRAQLAHRGREKDDAERRHRVEISVYRRKLKAVLSEQRAAAADEKNDGDAAGWLARRRHADAELRLGV
ncbi:growth arrest-specific protein 8-like [Hippocampus comes]|uniref:growth arrest-specific protein 8-like n=1 Tax=Hippocampus comes TaxID=109280 RepID=UPI00094F1D77|nr:PREDICTED: growth arrest-specific protein 8-like [Hippocampus comes]